MKTSKNLFKKYIKNTKPITIMVSQSSQVRVKVVFLAI